MNLSLSAHAANDAAPLPEQLHAVLLTHARQSRNKRDLADATHHGSGSNPLCGDRVVVAVEVHDDLLHDAAFKGRGCMACMASASLMTEAIRQQPVPEVRQLCENIRLWMDKQKQDWEPPSLLAPLQLARQRPARRRCMALAWEALADALA